MITRHIFNEDNFDLYKWISRRMHALEKLVFHNCSFSVLSGRNTVFLAGELSFNNCTFTEVNVTPHYGSSKFNKCFFDTVKMKYDTYYDLSMTECTFENCEIHSCTFKRSFFKKLSLKSFSDCTYADSSFEGITEIGEFSNFNSCSVKKSCFKIPRRYEKTCKACGLKTY